MILIVCCVGYLVLQDIYLGWRVIRHAREYPLAPLEDGNLPSVAVFVAARNEEKNLPECLEALAALKYPTHKISFYVGDDGSSDGTLQILKHWEAEQANRKVRIFNHFVHSGQNGKAKVLAALIAESDADLYLFTDADCSVPPTWAIEMVRAFRAEFGLITGITQVADSHWFGRMQALEWWLSLGMVKVVADFGFCLTAMGNNMLISAAAYREVGGFEEVLESVTEDLAISAKLYHQGFRPVHLVNKQCLVHTKAISSFAGLMAQRKRWARGALSLSWFWVLLLGIQLAFFPMVVLGLWMSPLLFLVGWGLKIGAQAFFISAFAGRAETKIPILDLILFEGYFLTSSMATLVYYIWPTPIRWKGRSYSLRNDLIRTR